MLFTTKHTYKHDWDTVSVAWWRKYPNKHAKHVKAVDTVDTTVCPETGNLTSTRVIMCDNYLPNWIIALGVSPVQYAVEHAVANARDKTLVIRSRNISGSSVMVVEERCEYRQHPDRADWTEYEQEAKIKAFLPFVYAKLERYTHSNFTTNSHKGLEVIEGLCERLREHHVVRNGMAKLDDVPKFLLDLARF